MNARVEVPKKAKKAQRKKVKKVKKTKTGRVSRARKTTKEPVKIYSYHVQLKREDMQVARQLLWEARNYYNDQVAIENGRRRAFREMRARLCPWLAVPEANEAALDEKLFEMRKEIRRQRKESRSGSADQDLVDETKRVCKKRDALRKECSKLRKEAHKRPDVKEEAARIDDLARTLKNNLNRHTDLHWTTKGIQDKACKQAADMTPWYVSFKRFSDRGRIGGQVRARGKGEERHLTTEGLFLGRSTQLAIDPLPIDQWNTRSGRRHACTKARFVVDRRNGPICFEFDVLMHRPLPAGALIKNAWLLFDMVKDDPVVKLQLTVESPLFFREKKKFREPVAVSICYRNLEFGQGAHVATAVTLGGEVLNLILPEHEPYDRSSHSAGKSGSHRTRRRYCLRDMAEKADELKSVADRILNEARTVAIEAKADGLIPDRLEEMCEHMAQWRSEKRFYRLAHKLCDPYDKMYLRWSEWRCRSIIDEVDLYAPYEEIADSEFGDTPEERLAFYFYIWMKKDKHLRQWEARLRKKVVARRKAIFTDFVNHFAEDYDVVMCKATFKEATTKMEAEQESQSPQLRFFRSLCSPGKLMAMFQEKGARVVNVKVEDEDGLDELNTATAKCIALLRHEGYDTSLIEEKLRASRGATEVLRNFPVD